MRSSTHAHRASRTSSAQRVAASGSREALQYLVPDTGTESGERLERLTWDQTRERADAVGRRARGPGRRARGPRRHRLDHAGGVGPRRPRHHDRRRGDDDDLPDHARRRRRLHRHRLGQQVVFAENAAQVQKLRDHRDELPGVLAGRHLRRQRGRRRDGRTAGSSPPTAGRAGRPAPGRRADRARRAHRGAHPRAPRRRSSTRRARPAGPRACC